MNILRATLEPRRISRLPALRRAILRAGRIGALFFVTGPAFGAALEQPSARQFASAELNVGSVVPQTGSAQIDIDDLTLDSDFTIFMGPDVPPELRNKALRKLWKLMPQGPVEPNSAI